MIALGVDPGTRHLGWGVVRATGNRIAHVAHGVIDTDASQPLAQRLVAIDTALANVIARYAPNVGSVESLFFHKDPQAAAKLGHARGVVLLNLARKQVEVFEYPPAQIKRAITGKGQADKRQVAMMVRTLLTLDEPPPSDAADALAAAITHLRRAPIGDALKSRAPVVDNPGIARLIKDGGYRPARRKTRRRRGKLGGSPDTR